MEVEETKNQQETLSDIQVNLDDKHNPVTPEKPKDEPKYVRIEDLEAINKAINNTRGYNERKLNEINAKLEQLANSNKVQKSEAPKDEWEEKLQKDWKGTVEELAERKLEAKLKEREERMRAEAEAARTYQLLENNKRQVLSKHTELNDESSQKAEIYRQVLQEHPEYISNPFGPVLAMRDMEDRLREQGVYDAPVRQAVDKEVARQARTNGSGVPKGNANPAVGKSITLTREQKEFCDANNIKYESYAKSLSMLSNKREIEG